MIEVQHGYGFMIEVSMLHNIWAAKSDQNISSYIHNKKGSPVVQGRVGLLRTFVRSLTFFFFTVRGYFYDSNL